MVSWCVSRLGGSEGAFTNELGYLVRARTQDGEG